MGKTILVIEDDKTLKRNISLLLEEEGYSVVTASNGAEGLELAVKLIPDLIICDVMMPQMNGYEVLKKLSENKKTSVVPFIFLTAKVEKNDLRLGMDLGADDYLFKPFQSDVLLRAIKTRLKKYDVIRAELVVKDKDKNEKPKKLDGDDKLFLTVGDEVQFVKVDEIVFISAENQYSNLYMKDGRTILIRKPLSHWENILANTTFLRIHRSTIINTNFIEKIDKWFNNSYRLFLKGIDDPFNISRGYASQLISNI